MILSEIFSQREGWKVEQERWRERLSTSQLGRSPPLRRSLGDYCDHFFISIWDVGMDPKVLLTSVLSYFVAARPEHLRSPPDWDICNQIQECWWRRGGWWRQRGGRGRQRRRRASSIRWIITTSSTFSTPAVKSISHTQKFPAESYLVQRHYTFQYFCLYLLHLLCPY